LGRRVGPSARRRGCRGTRLGPLGQVARPGRVGPIVAIDAVWPRRAHLVRAPAAGAGCASRRGARWPPRRRPPGRRGTRTRLAPGGREPGRGRQPGAGPGIDEPSGVAGGLRAGAGGPRTAREAGRAPAAPPAGGRRRLGGIARGTRRGSRCRRDAGRLVERAARVRARAIVPGRTTRGSGKRGRRVRERPGVGAARGGPADVLQGSVARTVADRARRPTLVVPAAAGRAHLAATADYRARQPTSA
jgi:hypothetical protein